MQYAAFSIPLIAVTRLGCMAPGGQEEAPYLEALRAYAARNPGRFHVPGHKGGPAADPALIEAIGAQALALDIPALTQGIDAGPEPTPVPARPGDWRPRRGGRAAAGS